MGKEERRAADAWERGIGRAPRHRRQSPTSLAVVATVMALHRRCPLKLNGYDVREDGEGGNLKDAVTAADGKVLPGCWGAGVAGWHRGAQALSGRGLSMPVLLPASCPPWECHAQDPVGCGVEPALWGGSAGPARHGPTTGSSPNLTRG